MPGSSLPSENDGRERRDPHLEDFVRRVQLVAGQFDVVDASDVCKQCTRIAEVVPGLAGQANTAIACAVMMDLIARIASSEYSPPQVPLIVSAARLCGKLDVGGMAAVLTSCSADRAARAGEAHRALGDPRVERAILQIRASHGQPALSLRTIADGVHLSPWHLAHLLVHHSGKSFKAHLQEARLRHAASLLAETFLTIKEIAHLCGYGQVETFERAFKKRLRLPPTLWRARCEHRPFGKKRQRTARIDD
jgi:AraC-like DNA-binding protein